jgi:hypothetical protein
MNPALGAKEAVEPGQDGPPVANVVGLVARLELAAGLECAIKERCRISPGRRQMELPLTPRRAWP